MLRAVEWIHSCGVVHRNIKASNFMCGGDKGNTIMKLTDFGLACAQPQGSRLYQEAGSWQYRSVEMHSKAGYNEKTDIWSFGVMAYALLFNEFPYAPQQRDKDAIRAAIMQNSEPRFVQVPIGQKVGEFLGPAARFCRVLLRRNQDIRCSATEALQLGFITGMACSMEMEADCSNVRKQDHHPEVRDLAPASGWEWVSGADSQFSDFTVELTRQELAPLPLIGADDLNGKHSAQLGGTLSSVTFDLELLIGEASKCGIRRCRPQERKASFAGSVFAGLKLRAHALVFGRETEHRGKVTRARGLKKTIGFWHEETAHFFFAIDKNRKAIENRIRYFQKEEEKIWRDLEEVRRQAAAIEEGRSRTIEKKLADRAIQQERDLMLQQNRVKAAQNRVSVTDYRKRQQFEAMREKQLSAQVQRETSQAIMHQKRQIDMEMRKTNSERAAMIQISQKEARSRASQERSARLERVREFQEYERQQAEQEVLEAESTLPELEEQELICLQRLQNSRIVTQSVLEELETRLGSQSSVATLLRSKQRSTDQLESVGGLSTGLPQEPEAAQLDDAGTAGEATGQPVEPITEPVAA
ncbi:unnamed protein product [Effrenium voratum]|uniref:Protein kinase domain-containing protein n=1 Tax=Effrenium voratum TaxID=2562239 RepID=A0AA36JN84_9DINO|nr:unnamed protein product [Effrenium voratum]